MNFSGKHFEYDGTSSLYDNLFIGHIDTEALTQMSDEIKYNTTYLKATHRHCINSKDWSDSPFSFEMEIISENPIDKIAQRRIYKWLFNKSDYKKLYVALPEDEDLERINGEIKRLYLSCVLVNPKKIEYSTGIHGWKCTCILETPMAIQDAITTIITPINGTASINIDTDINEYVYPEMVINISYTPVITTSAFVLGDVNRDGYVGAADASMVLQASVDKCELDSEQQLLADVNNDGYINAADSLLLLSYSVGKLTSSDGYAYENINKLHPVFSPATVTVTIANATDNSEMAIVGVGSNDVISADCAVGIITATTPVITTETDYYYKLKNQHFLRLLPGVNALTVSSEISSISLTWHNERWIV